MMATLKGHLNPCTFLESSRPMGLRHLKEIEDHVSASGCHHSSLKELVFGGSVEGTTPLLLATHYGEFHSVKHIVERWQVDIQAAATYYGFRFRIQSATALYVAACQGHSKIVRYLLEKGADVTAKTFNQARPQYHGLTPIYGAIHELRQHKSLAEKRQERSSIIRSLLEFGADPSASVRPSDGHPVWMGNLCSVDATTALINFGMDLKQRELGTGGTILHHWAGLPDSTTEEESLIIVKLLLHKGADLKVRDNLGFSPLLRAANGKCGTRPNLAVFDFLFERDDFSRREKIDALELVGAIILRHTDRGDPTFRKAFDYWRRSLHLRQMVTEESAIVKTPLLRESGGIVEWATMEQLEHVIQRPSEYWIQSLLVQFRILSSMNWTVVKSLFHLIVSDRDSIDCELHVGNSFGLVDILWAMLETISLFDPHEEGLWEATIEIVSVLIRAIPDVLRGGLGWDEGDYPAGKSCTPQMIYKKIKTSIELILVTDQFHLADRERGTDTEAYCTNTLLLLLEELSSLPDEGLDQEALKFLSQLIGKRGCDERGRNILHIACTNFKRNILRLPTVRLILRTGVDPNAGDVEGNGPLHLAAQLDQEVGEPLVLLLLEFGAHLDRLNKFKKTAADVWVDHNEMVDDRKEEEGADGWNHRPDWCRTLFKLQCFSARVIRSHQVPYKKKLPLSLRRFIELH